MAPVNDNPLGGLIERERKRLELSFRELQAKSAGRLTRSDFTNWNARVYKRLSPDKLVALADVLEVPLPVVVEAALATMGLDAGRTRTIEDAIRADETLDELTKRQLLRIIEDRRRDADVAAGPREEATAARRVDPADTGRDKLS